MYSKGRKKAKILPWLSGDWGGCRGRTMAVSPFEADLDLPLKASKVSAVSKTMSSDNCWPALASSIELVLLLQIEGAVAELLREL